MNSFLHSDMWNTLQVFGHFSRLAEISAWRKSRGYDNVNFEVNVSESMSIFDIF